MKALIDSISNARDSKSIDANMIPRATVYERGRNLVEVDSVPEFSMKNCCVDIMKMLIVSHVNIAIRRLMKMMISCDRVSALSS